jgi:hypothetical protein
VSRNGVDGLMTSQSPSFEKKPWLGRQEVKLASNASVFSVAA